MDRPARLFLCALCRPQVLLCSHCDRGQRYCSPACASASRCGQRRAAAQRYQRSPGGRRKHAARSAGWRQRQRQRMLQQGGAVDVALGATNKVTHQGCPAVAAQVVLMACDTPSASELIVLAEPVPQTAPVVLGVAPNAAPSAAPQAVLVCRRCAAPLLPFVRQSYLCPRSHRWRHAHDHPR